MSNLPQVVKFNNQDVPVFMHEGKPYVAVQPICENIGLDWEAQRQRIKRNHVLNSITCMIKVVAKDKKIREVVALPIGYLNGWLFGIDVNRVKAGIKETLIKYQLECFDVLYKHFMPKVSEIHPNTITIEQQQAIKDAVLAKVHREGKTYQAVYNEFYRVFNIPRYQELPLGKFDEAMNWLNDGFVKSADKNIDLVRELVEDILMQNFMLKNVWLGLYHLDKRLYLDTMRYVVDSNVTARKVINSFNLKTKQGKDMISMDFKVINFYDGVMITGCNPNYFNAPA